MLVEEHISFRQAITLVLTARTGSETSSFVLQDGVAAVLHKSTSVSEIAEAARQKELVRLPDLFASGGTLDNVFEFIESPPPVSTVIVGRRV
jgi:sulfur transfer complex TusBCD TusB component (DsrH family)